MATGTGHLMYELQKRIRSLESEIGALDRPAVMPELVETANLLRSNEYLSKLAQRQGDLISAYSEYSVQLASMLEAVFDIQNELKDILREQSSMIGRSGAKRPRSAAKPKRSSKRTAKRSR